MKLLIDTNIFLFSIVKPECLDSDVVSLLSDYENRIYISTVSIKESIHLLKAGKVSPKKKRDHIDLFEELKNFNTLPVSIGDLKTYYNLNTIEGHNDPNDHLIISQAMNNKMILISSDTKFKYYTSQGLDFIFNKK